jgi:hypothetical protein
MPQSPQGRAPFSVCSLSGVLLFAALLGIVGMHHAPTTPSPVHPHSAVDNAEEQDWHDGRHCTDPVGGPVCPASHESLHSCPSLPAVADSVGSLVRLGPIIDAQSSCAATLSAGAMSVADRGPPGLPVLSFLARLGVLRL